MKTAKIFIGAILALSLLPLYAATNFNLVCKGDKITNVDESRIIDVANGVGQFKTEPNNSAAFIDTVGKLYRLKFGLEEKEGNMSLHWFLDGLSPEKSANIVMLAVPDKPKNTIILIHTSRNTGTTIKKTFYICR